MYKGGTIRFSDKLERAIGAAMLRNGGEVDYPGAYYECLAIVESGKLPIMSFEIEGVRFTAPLIAVKMDEAIVFGCINLSGIIIIQVSMYSPDELDVLTKN